MASTLESLPAELLEKIIAHVNHDMLWDDLTSTDGQHWRMMRSISSVSRTLRQCCDPFVFCTFPSSSPTREQPLRPFLRSLIERPYLTRYVRRLWLSLDDDSVSVPSDADCQLFTTAMKAFHDFDWYECVLRGLLGGCPKAEAVLLFALCSKLRELRLGAEDPFKAIEQEKPSSASTCPYCDGIVASACITSLIATSKSDDSYLHLKKVEVWDAEEAEDRADPPVTSGIAGPILRLPGLERLQMSHCRIDDISSASAGGTVKNAALKYLTLQDCEIDTDPLTSLLQCCEALRLARITWKEGNPMDVSAILSALQRHEASIRVLHLGNYGNIDLGASHSFSPAADTFVRFEMLHVLEINDTLLTGNSTWDATDLVLPTLPANLKMLNIHTLASLDELGGILAKLGPKMSDSMWVTRISFPVSEDNAQYVDSIQETDFARGRAKATNLKGKSWSVLLSRGDGSSLFIVFCFWRKKTQSIRQTFGDLSAEIADAGVKDVLINHSEGIEVDKAEAEALEGIRAIVRMAWPDDAANDDDDDDDDDDGVVDG